jgi:hypothetical protein
LWWCDDDNDDDDDDDDYNNNNNNNSNNNKVVRKSKVYSEWNQICLSRLITVMNTEAPVMATGL